MSGRPFGDFGIDISFDELQVIVGVRGEVDAFTAPTLVAVLGALILEQHTDVVLDLCDLRFMGAAGLRAIAVSSLLLAQQGEVMSVRSAPRAVLRILEVTGLDSVVHLLPESDHSGVSDRVRQAGVLAQAAVTSQGLSPQPAGGSRVDGRVGVSAALGLVTVLASATVFGANGASVTLVRAGGPATVAASDEIVRRMDQYQYDTGEGPCLAAAASGEQFRSDSLTRETRWPAFVELAKSEGIASILSTPLLVDERAVGALNIYSNGDLVFGAQQQELATIFASQASGILADAGADLGGADIAPRIADALFSREVIAQAQGVLMARQHIDAERAAAILYRSARRAVVPVRLQAAGVIETTKVGANESGAES